MAQVLLGDGLVPFVRRRPGVPGAQICGWLGPPDPGSSACHSMPRRTTLKPSRLHFRSVRGVEVPRLTGIGVGDVRRVLVDDVHPVHEDDASLAVIEVRPARRAQEARDVRTDRPATWTPRCSPGTARRRRWSGTMCGVSASMLGWLTMCCGVAVVVVVVDGARRGRRRHARTWSLHSPAAASSSWSSVAWRSWWSWLPSGSWSSSKASATASSWLRHPAAAGHRQRETRRP